jgi:hypothetical protein
MGEAVFLKKLMLQQTDGQSWRRILPTHLAYIGYMPI